MFPFGEDVICQVSFLSRCSPRYLTWSSQGSCTRATVYGERYVDRFEGVGLNSPFFEPDLDCEEMRLKFLGGCGRITVHG
jgi:hypothetical protein